MLLLDRSVSTKVTTLNRLNFFRTLVFMGNGNGLVSHGKGRSQTPEGSLQAAIEQCKKNLIAIPLDVKCTLPLRIKKRFQDYDLELRPIPGFNGWGHPTMATMLALTGFKHMAFKTNHNSKNNYDLVNCFFKTVTKNTTPKELA
jgi:small subunit ribosomal protein S5